MSLQNATLPLGGTPSVAGGSTITYGVTRNTGNQITAVVTADTDFRTRRSFRATAKSPSIKTDAPNGYTQQRNEIRFDDPILLSNGKHTTNSIGVWISFDPEASAAQKQALLDKALAAVMDSDFTDFMKLGSTV